MLQFRSRRLWLLPALALVTQPGCYDSQAVSEPSAAATISSTAAVSQPTLVDKINVSLAGAARFLSKQQSTDGAWRSDVYAPFKEGDALTPCVLMALTALPREQQPADCLRRGRAYLESLVGADGAIAPPRYGVAYPVYTAAGALISLANQSDAKAISARDAWLVYLRGRQLTEANGWSPGDAFYGGWGYDAELPRKPPPGVPVGPLTEPNLSATAFAVTALRAAGIEADAPELQKALHFIVGCQNWADSPDERSKWDDGGFFFVQSDEVRNKAGVAGIDADGRSRFASYGSATADGIRACRACGLTGNDPRVQAAWRWMAENFSATRHPGDYAEGRQAERDSVYFYYCLSLSEALAAADPQSLPPDVDRRGWASALAAALMARQQPDGSWINAEVEVRENDPLVATSLAARALAVCRQMILVESEVDPQGLSDDDREQPSDSPADARR